MPDVLQVSAPAKINLYLKIIGRRPDGYHELATLMQKISLADQIILERQPKGITLLCPDSDLPENNDNLMHRAATLFLETMKDRISGNLVGVKMTLEKKIPVAAGLGGGSSDAAAVLRGLDSLWQTGCTTDELIKMGTSLGADVPFFIVKWSAAWATGIGEILDRSVPLSGFHILLVNPGFFVSTQWVYKTFALTAEKKKINLKDFGLKDIATAKGRVFLNRSIRPEELENDLETVTGNYYREIDMLKNFMHKKGSVASMMTGSGPTVFGLFRKNDFKAAKSCFELLKSKYRDSFLISTDNSSN